MAEAVAHLRARGAAFVHSRSSALLALALVLESCTSRAAEREAERAGIRCSVRHYLRRSGPPTTTSPTFSRLSSVVEGRRRQAAGGGAEPERTGHAVRVLSDVYPASGLCDRAAARGANTMVVDQRLTCGRDGPRPAASFSGKTRDAAARRARQRRRQRRRVQVTHGCSALRHAGLQLPWPREHHRAPSECVGV